MDSFEYEYYYELPNTDERVYFSKFSFSDLNEKSLFEKAENGDIRHRFRVVDSRINILNVPLYDTQK